MKKKEPQTLNSCAGRCSNRSLIAHRRHRGRLELQEKSWPSTQEGKRHVLSCIQGTPRTPHPGFYFPTALLPFHLAKLLPDNEIRRKILKWLARTRERSCRRGGRKKKERYFLFAALGKIVFALVLRLTKTSTAYSLLIAHGKGNRD